MKDGGRKTFLPDLMSSRLLVVVMSSQPTTRVISGQEATCQSTAGLVLVNSHVVSELEDSEESQKVDFIHRWCCDLGSGTSRNDWQNLSVVSCQNQTVS